MKPILLISVLMFALSACGPMVTFDRPQPEGVDSLTVLPRKLTGRYVSKNEAAVLQVDRQSMILQYDYEVRLPKVRSDSDSLTDEGNLVVNDSVVEHVVENDTLFGFSADRVMKKYRGYYFLSTRNDLSSWFVRKIRLEKGVLTIASISTKEEIRTLEKVNESPIDTTTYRIRFSRKQFHKYIDSKGFSKADTFIRVKPGRR